MIKIDNIIGINAYTSNGLKLDVRTITGSARNGDLIEEINGVWKVMGKDEAAEGC